MQIRDKTKRNFYTISYFESKFIKFVLFLFFFNFIILSYNTGHTWAIGNIHLGSIELHPFFNTTAGYVDNAYLAPDGYEKSSSYNSFTPGIRCDWNKTKYRIQLSYLYEFFRYDIREVDDKDLFDFNSKFDFRFGKNGHGINMHGGYDYLKTSDPYTSEQRADNRKEGNVKFGVKLNMRDRFGISFDSKLIQHRFIDDTLARKWNQDIVNLLSKVNIRPFTKTDILLEYGLIISDYSNPLEYNSNPNETLNDNSKTHSLLTGFEWEATAKIIGVFKAGYQWKKYNDPKGIGNRSPETWKVHVDLKHTLSEFTSFQLGFERSIDDSYFQYAAKDAVFYYTNRMKLALDHKLTHKIGTWVDISYNYSKYNNIPRKDEVWQFDLGVDYQFLDWIGAHINYHSRIRNTNIHESDTLDNPDTFDYKNNQYNIGLNLVF
jgi:hypothetical protein